MCSWDLLQIRTYNPTSALSSLATVPVSLASATQRTGRAGVFQLSLRPGFYDLCAFTAGFSASCQKIYVPANNATLRRKIKLSLDPVVEKELGDVFQ